MCLQCMSIPNFACLSPMFRLMSPWTQELQNILERSPCCFSHFLNKRFSLKLYIYFEDLLPYISCVASLFHFTNLCFHLNIIVTWLGKYEYMFWFDDRIYWTLRYSAWLQFTVYYYTVSTFKSSLSLLGSGYQWRIFPFFRGFPKCLRPQLSASYSNSHDDWTVAVISPTATSDLSCL
jgi:hypothetical protein